MKSSEKQERKNSLATDIYRLREEAKFLLAIRHALAEGYVDLMYPCLHISGALKKVSDTLVYHPEPGSSVDIALWDSRGRLPQALELLITDLQEQVTNLEQELEKFN